MASNTAGLEIVIVGAGLAGLAASIECALAGHSVSVLEGAQELAEIGAGLQMTPNSSRLLEAWGVYDKLKHEAVEPKAVVVHRYSGRILAHEHDFDSRMRLKYGAPFADLHRADLQRGLAARAQELGVRLRLGEKVVELDLEPARPKVATAAGHEYRCHLVVAADGLWSRCRECWLGREDAPLATGDVAYRIVLALDQIKDADLRDWVTNAAVHFWIGPHAHVVGYTLRGGSMYNIVLLVPDDLPESVVRQAGCTDEMRRLFQGWDPILTRFLECVDRVDKWKLMHRAPMESWVSARGNMVMVGDSCHPMLPYLAQGANSALEDGAVLGRVLAGVQRPGPSLSHALALFQRLRKTRGEAIVRETFKQRESFHMPDGPEQAARDRVFLSQLGKEIDCAFPSRWTCPQVQPWLFGYDAWKEVEMEQARGV